MIYNAIIDAAIKLWTQGNTFHYSMYNNIYLEHNTGHQCSLNIFGPVHP